MQSEIVSLFNEHLKRYPVAVIVDARLPEVQLPETLQAEYVILQYGLNLPVPIPDLEVTEAGISATLSFKQQPHKTFIPWEAVLAFGEVQVIVEQWMKARAAHKRKQLGVDSELDDPFADPPSAQKRQLLN